MSKLHDELAALTDMDPAQLHARWQLLEGSPAPALATPLLRRLLAQRLQERRYGAISAAVQRELARIAAGEPNVPSETVRKALTTGTRLVREWNGRTITVEVSDEGFVHAGRSWRSLSEIARHVTGAHWSGPRFFGVTGRG
jgi:hypothetical protein